MIGIVVIISSRDITEQVDIFIVVSVSVHRTRRARAEEVRHSTSRRSSVLVIVVFVSGVVVRRKDVMHRGGVNFSLLLLLLLAILSIVTTASDDRSVQNGRGVATSLLREGLLHRVLMRLVIGMRLLLLGLEVGELRPGEFVDGEVLGLILGVKHHGELFKDVLGERADGGERLAPRNARVLHLVQLGGELSRRDGVALVDWEPRLAFLWIHGFDLLQNVDHLARNGDEEELGVVEAVAVALEGGEVVDGVGNELDVDGGFELKEERGSDSDRFTAGDGQKLVGEGLILDAHSLHSGVVRGLRELALLEIAEVVGDEDGLLSTVRGIGEVLGVGQGEEAAAVRHREVPRVGAVLHQAVVGDGGLEDDDPVVRVKVALEGLDDPLVDVAVVVAAGVVLAVGGVDEALEVLLVGDLEHVGGDLGDGADKFVIAEPGPCDGEFFFEVTAEFLGVVVGCLSGHFSRILVVAILTKKKKIS